MTFRIASFLAVSCLLSGVVHSVKVIQKNHDDVLVKIGEQVELICTADVEAVACTFRTPSGQTYTMFPGASYEGRINQHGQTKKDCGLQITNVQESDNGNWECSVTGKTSAEDSEYSVGTGNLMVVVAVPPKDVHLMVKGQRVTGPLVLDLEVTKELVVKCMAFGARPAPTFNWYIGQNLINGVIEQTEEESEGKVNYVSTLKYFADPMHNGQELKCEVAHMGYSMAQLEDLENWATADLSLEFRPEQRKKETFYKMKEGESNDVRIKFRANPKPEKGQWKLGDTVVPVGASSIDEMFTSSPINGGQDIEGEYEVVLTIVKLEKKMAGQTYTLEVSNGLGTTKYQFDLALSDKPPTEGASGPVIGIIILVVIIIVVGGIAVIARAKGALCFAAKSGEPLDEEKEAFDDPEKGELNAKPAVPPPSGDSTKNTPDKKPEAETKTKPEAEDNKEEKKSNGGHTPV